MTRNKQIEVGVSPTIPFVVEEALNPLEEDQALLDATKIAETFVAERHLQEFQKTGGVIGFSNPNHKKRKFEEPTGKGWWSGTEE